eukprot:1185417-Prorocentrum_minimum.AAC.1
MRGREKGRRGAGRGGGVRGCTPAAVRWYSQRSSWLRGACLDPRLEESTVMEMVEARLRSNSTTSPAIPTVTEEQCAYLRERGQ